MKNSREDSCATNDLSMLAFLAAVSTISLWPCTAMAQVLSSAEGASASDAKSNAGSEEIIVTAQRREQRLQDVPIAISALSGDALTDRGITSLESLTTNVPSLAISGFAGANSTNLVSIRGIAGQPVAIGAGQATAIYLDGVYLSKPDSAFFQLADVSRIEVLRGPQGTLYGRNATAGAINIVTLDPGDTLRASADVSYGNFDHVAARGYLSGPLGAGLSASVAGGFNRHDGFSYNTYNNKTVPSTREYNGRVKLRYSNDGNFDAVLSGDYTNNFSPSVFRNVLAYPSGAYIGLGTGDPNQVTDNFGDDVGNRVRTGGVALTMNLEVSPTFTVTSITSWRQFRYEAAYTVPYPPYGFYNVFARTGNNTFNQEIRGVYNHNGLSATFGANFYHETGHYATVAAISPTAPTVSAASPPGQRDETSLDAYAIFGQIEYQLLPKLTVMAGLRYNSESRDYSIQYFSTPSLYNGHVSDNVLIPMVGANYDFTDDVMFYAKASRGYQAPGFNYIPGAGVTTDTSFKAETLWAYEAGLKAQFLDRKVTLNLAGFYYDYKDLQVRANRSVTLYKIANAASARVKGFEAELSVRPVDWLTLSAQVTRATAEYVSYCEGSAGGTPQNGDRACTSSEGFPGYERAGNLLTQSPKWNGGVNAAVHAPIGNDTFLDASVSYGFQSRLFFTPSNIIAASSQPWQRLDARVAIAMPNGMTVYAYGKNLTNKRYINWSSIVAPASILGSVNDPMTYGIGLRFEM